jgi:CBS domain-containing protein
MPQRIAELMTTDPVTMEKTTDLQTAALAMRDHDIGDVIVTNPDGSLCGIVTDRDIVVRGVAAGMGPANATLDDVCAHNVVTLGPDDSVAAAIAAMEEHAIRRLPVVDNGNILGIVSIGDLAIERDPESALGEISAAPANN